ncbi:MAG: hypothetical protein NC548_56510 [Lachnospiraceae bacterium]|nr:hypothetical protein [Lachnospiraceae bacterium]
MVKFGDLSENEKQAFGEVLKKNQKSLNKEQQTQIWPEDDEELTKSYFKEVNHG